AVPENSSLCFRLSFLKIVLVVVLVLDESRTPTRLLVSHSSSCNYHGSPEVPPSPRGRFHRRQQSSNSNPSGCHPAACAVPLKSWHVSAIVSPAEAGTTWPACVPNEPAIPQEPALFIYELRVLSQETKRERPSSKGTFGS